MSVKFCDRLKNARKNNNISQKNLAERLYVSQQTIAKWETDKATPNPETITKIADILNVSLDYLLGSEKATQTEQPASQKLKNLIDSYADLSEDEIDQVTNFVAFLRTKRNF